MIKKLLMISKENQMGSDLWAFYVMMAGVAFIVKIFQ
jgi:hypothetical protein